MSDRALANAEAKRNQLVDRKRQLLVELTDIDEQVGQIDRFIKAWHAFAEDEPQKAVENLSDSGANKTATSEPVNRKATGNSRKEDVAATARRVILERGAPITRDDLYDLLTAEGLVIQGKDPQMVLSTMLWRMRDQIARVKGGGYWPADIPNEEIGYDPATARDIDNTLNKPLSEILDPDSDIAADARQQADGGNLFAPQPRNHGR